MLRRTPFIGGLACLALALTACNSAEGSSSGGGGNSADGDTIPIGNVTAITGMGGTFDGYRAGLVAYVEWLNDQGGIDGKQVELFLEDDEADPAKNAAAVRRLVEERGIIATVGDATQGSSAGGAPYLEEQGIPAIAGWGNGEEWFGQHENLFVIVSSQGEERCAPWLADMAIADDAQDVAFFGYDIPIGIQDIECHLAAWEAQGQAEPVARPAYASLTQADYRPIIQPAIDAGAQNLIVNIGASDMARFIQAAEQLGFEGNYYGGGGVSGALMNSLDAQLSAAVQGRLFGPSFSALAGDDGEELANFAEYIPAEFAEDPFAVSGWAAGVVFADAVAEVGPSSTALLDHMYDLPSGYDANGLVGPLEYERGELGPARCILYIVWNGTDFERADMSGDGFNCSEIIDPGDFDAFK
ncbi:ABC transporter substrate-binding protein [Trujillonella humicola]|uniref:ABC transporter substrate-binding protein n=1 Tax=Trujillonella humicola TaxID=3383699 RepID=UPI003905E22C